MSDNFDSALSHPANSHFSKEMRRWDTPKRNGGMRCDGFEQFPRMMYKALRPVSGGPIRCVDPGDEGFSGRNQLTVHNGQELEDAERNGWRQSPALAVEHANKLEESISDAAAYRAGQEKRMSAKARAEAAVVDAATPDHVPEITAQPTKARRIVTQEHKDKMAAGRKAAAEARKAAKA